MHSSQPYLYIGTLLLILLVSCGKEESANGFNGVVDPNASIEGLWTSVAYDFTKKNTVTLKTDSAFSFTGAILKENFKADGNRIRNFLGFEEIYTYKRVDKEVTFFKDNDSATAILHTLSSTHLAYTLERFVNENDTIRRFFTSAQLVK